MFWLVTHLMKPVHMHTSWQMNMAILSPHPFDDLAVATGQGSIAMEIIKELPTVDYILVPIGGGGLYLRCFPLCKTVKSKIKVIGVEPAGANCMQGL